MKVRYLGKGSPRSLIHNKIYEVVPIESDFYRIVDETGADFLYHKNNFEIVDDSDPAPVIDV